MKFPVILTIKDANSDDCIVDTLQIWLYDKTNNRDSLVLRTLFGGLTVNSARWEYFWEISVNNLKNPPYNLIINENDTLKLRIRLSFRDNVTPEYFIKTLRI